MATTPDKLKSVMDQFFGGSDGRFRHPFNRRFIYTEGVKAMAEEAGAYWLLDIVATEVARLVISHYDATGNPRAMLTIKVADDEADIEMSFSDDAVDWKRHIDFTDFPEGTWTFELAMDGLIDAPREVLVMLLLQEH